MNKAEIKEFIRIMEDEYCDTWTEIGVELQYSNYTL